MTEAAEIVWLLRFFAQPVSAQWAEVPASLGRVWVHLGDVDSETSQPIRLLALILAEQLNGCTRYFDIDREPELIEQLEELRVLLAWFILESPHRVLYERQEDPEQLHAIWRTVGRLCLLVGGHPALAKVDAGGLSFEHFLRYTAALG